MKHLHLLLLSLIVATSLNCMEKEKQWEIVKTFNQPHLDVRAVDFNSDATTLAIASGDMKSHLFNVDSETEIQSFNNHNQITRAICIHNTLVATGSDDTIARLIDAVTKKEIKSFNNKDIIMATKMNHSGSQLAVAANHTVRLYDLVKNKRLISIQHQDEPISVCFNQQDNRIITASLNTVRIFDIRQKNKEIESFDRKNRYIASVLTNADNNILTVETPGNTIQIYNDTTKEVTNTGIPVAVEPVFATCYHPGKQLLALGLNSKALIFAPDNQK